MFSFINLILTLFILVRVYRTDRFYTIHLDKNVRDHIEKKVK